MTEPARIRDLALFLLAASRRRPRQRARDQKPDQAGAELRRRLLSRLVELDPEDGDLDSTLLGIIGELEPPLGPQRAIAVAVRDELLAARENSTVLELLIQDALGAESPLRESPP